MPIPIVNETNNKLLSESLFDLGLFLCPNRCHVVSRSVVRGGHLVERVVGVLLELLPDSGLPLIQAQANTAAVLLHLLESPLLVLSERGGESSLGMSVDLVVILASGKGQGVESVVDTGCANDGGLAVVAVKLAKVQTTRLLNGGLGFLGSLSGGIGIVFGR